MRPEVIERPRIPVAGAREALDAFVAQRAEGTPAGVAAARTLLDADIDWPVARDAIVAAPRAVILGELDSGPVLAARAFRRDEPTTVHDHGVTGAAVLVEGRDRYERYERVGDRVRLESVHHLAAGDVVWWREPPDDVHRQVAVTDVAIELILVAGPPNEATALDVVEVDESDLRASITAGWTAGDIARLRPWYADDVLGDLNVPQWRFQVRGRDDLLDLLDREEFAKPDRRLSHLRVTDAADGLLLETEMRYTQDGDLQLFREVHRLRTGHGLVIEHVVWCTGIADATTIDAQLRTAPMERM